MSNSTYYQEYFCCDTCNYDIKGCCSYDEPLGKYCVLGNAYKPKIPKQISIFEIIGDTEMLKGEVT